jgi:hypothetical protein
MSLKSHLPESLLAKLRLLFRTFGIVEYRNVGFVGNVGSEIKNKATSYKSDVSDVRLFKCWPKYDIIF